jgi:molybdopterin molybdotransferase
MPEFLELLPPTAALAKLLENLPSSTQIETVPLSNALNRVTAAPIKAPHPLPSFARSTVDGFALLARDSFGASESLPAYLKLVGEVPMGSAPSFLLNKGECALIHTGGMLPEGADAVVMLEYTQSVSEREIEVLRSIANGENVLKVGEDVRPGMEVIPSGIRLRPPEMGGLAALGILDIQVARQPRVAILSTGDEIVPADQPIKPGQVRDVNTSTLSSLVQSSGGVPISHAILPDQAVVLRSTAIKVLKSADILVFTAGSSASTRDLTAEVINGLGSPGVLVHGVNIRPGKPTILAVCDGKTVIGLPGNPVSALLIARLFVIPVINHLLGLAPTIQAIIPAVLSINLASQAGREDWVPVRLISTPNGLQADPIFSKSNLIFSLARAEGLLRIPPDATGLEAGSRVEIIPF